MTRVITLAIGRVPITVLLGALVTSTACTRIGPGSGPAPAALAPSVAVSMGGGDQGSPFRQGKVALTASLLGQLSQAYLHELAGAVRLAGQSPAPAPGVIPAGFPLAIVVNDLCRLDRAARGDKAGLFDALLPPAEPAKGAGDLAERAYTLKLRDDTPLDRLEADARQDACVIGISQRFEYASAAVPAYNDPSYAQQTYLQEIRFEEGMTDLSGHIGGQKVRVGIVDTGLDFGNEDLGDVTGSLEGTDFVGLSAMPQDKNGHGTSVTGIIGARAQNQKGVVGIASGIAELIPVKVTDLVQHGLVVDSTLTSVKLFEAIRRAVNGGAQIINISFYALVSDLCDPVVGYALYKGIEKGALFVLSAGNGMRPGFSLGGVGTAPVPGELVAASDDGPGVFGVTASPACWGLYFKGALAVAALETGGQAIAPFSNYGNAVEMSAPGRRILTYGLANDLAPRDGTSFAAPQVTAALALVVAYHRAKGWPYTPWLIEDVLLNGSPGRPSLEGKVRNGKALDLKSLADHLAVLSGQTEERRHEPSENTREGAGWNPDQVQGTPIRLEVATKTPILKNTDTDPGRALFDARAYFDGVSYRIVTDETVWKTSDPTSLPIDAHGIAYPNKGVRGEFTITGTYQGVSGTATLSVQPISAVTGSQSALKALALVPPASSDCCFAYSTTDFRAVATYEDGAVRDVSQFASWSSSVPSELVPYLTPQGRFSTSKVYGGKAYAITAFYADDVRGGSAKGTTIFTVAKRPAQPFRILLIGDAKSGDNLTVNRGEALSTTAFMEISPGTRGPLAAVWKSDSALLNIPAQESVGFILSSKVPPAGVYGLSATAPYRGNGIDENLVAAATLTLRDAAIQAVTIEDSWGKQAQDLVAHGRGDRYYRARVTLNTGDKVLLPADELTRDFDWWITDPEGNPSPHSWVQIGYDCLPHIFAPGIGSTFHLHAKHRPTGIASAPFPIQTRGITQVVLDLGPPNIPSKAPVPVPTPSDPSYCDEARRNLAPMAGGAGTAADPYRICTSTQLLAMPSIPGAPDNAPAHYKLMANIDLSAMPLAAPINPKGTWELDGAGLGARPRPRRLRARLGGAVRLPRQPIGDPPAGRAQPHGAWELCRGWPGGWPLELDRGGLLRRGRGGLGEKPCGRPRRLGLVFRDPALVQPGHPGVLRGRMGRRPCWARGAGAHSGLVLHRQRDRDRPAGDDARRGGAGGLQPFELSVPRDQQGRRRAPAIGHGQAGRVYRRFLCHRQCHLRAQDRRGFRRRARGVQLRDHPAQLRLR